MIFPLCSRSSYRTASADISVNPSVSIQYRRRSNKKLGRQGYQPLALCCFKTVANNRYFELLAVHSVYEGVTMSHSPKLPKRAVYYRFYRECLDLAATHDLKVIPCQLCSVRRDLSVWESDFDKWDIVNCWFLVAAVFCPSLCHKYLVSVSHCKL